MSKPNYSVRIDLSLRQQAERAGLNLPHIFEAAIKRELTKKRCPLCGRSKRKPRTKESNT